MSTVEAPPSPPTARQLQILDFLAAYRDANGVLPTVREIGEALAIKSPNGVMGHLKALAKKGLLKRPRDGRSRSWVPVTICREEGCCPTCGRPRDDHQAAATE